MEVSTAAEMLGVSSRQVHQLRARFREEGFGAVVHGNSGHIPANRIDPALEDQILALETIRHYRPLFATDYPVEITVWI